MEPNRRQGGLREISPEALKNRIDRGEVVLVDVREPSEHAGERIPGSVLVPLSSFAPERLPAGCDVVLYCRSGNRSAQAAQHLLACGHGDVTHLGGGILRWKQAGLATEADAGAPISLPRQVQITSGTLVFAGTLLAALVSPWWLALPGFVGLGLIYAGASDTCAMGALLARLPYNSKARRQAA